MGGTLVRELCVSDASVRGRRDCAGDYGCDAQVSGGGCGQEREREREKKKKKKKKERKGGEGQGGWRNGGIGEEKLEE